MGEELGLVGVVAVLLLFVGLIVRIFSIGKRALGRDDLFAGFLAYGIGLWIGIQTVFSIGVNTGLLPTKGLTTPLISYGGSSLLVLLVGLGIVFRIDFENKQKSSA